MEAPFLIHSLSRSLSLSLSLSPLSTHSTSLSPFSDSKKSCPQLKNSTKEVADLLQKSSLESHTKTIQVTDATKKSYGLQRGSVDDKKANGTIHLTEWSTTPMVPDFTDPAMCYYPSGYPSTAYYYGGYDGSMNDWDDGSRYVNPDGVDMCQEKNANIKCFLVDPPGSGMFNKVTRGVMYTREEAEGKRLKNPFDTITEGIRINRLTKNFMMADLDGAVRVAQSIGPGHTVVTTLCDNGLRHLSKFYNAQYLSQHGLTPSATGLEFLGVS